MRALLAVALLAVVAAESCPIIKWLEEHGKDVLETAIDCKNVPAALKKARDSECRTKPSPRDRVAMAVWFAITEMQHLNGTLPEIVKHSRIAEKLKDMATMQILASSHKGIAKFCGQPQCSDFAKELSSAVSPCYGALTCNFMTKFVPFSACKDAFESYLETVVGSQLGAACESDEVVGHEYFCGEMSADLMYKDTDCFMEYKSGGVRGCTRKCLSQWQAMRSKFPKCTKSFGDQTENIYEAMRSMMAELAKSATDPNFKKAIENMPSSLATYDDTCNKKPTEDEDFVTGGTLKVTWKDCGTATTHAKINSFSPGTLTLGQKTTMTGTGSVDEAVTGGSFSISLKASIISKTFTGDICAPKSFPLPLGIGTLAWDGLKCPLAAGTQSVSVDVTLSGALPGSIASASIATTAKDSAGKDLICLDINTSPAAAEIMV